jgi:hypothetical protein
MTRHGNDIIHLPQWDFGHLDTGGYVRKKRLSGQFKPGPLGLKKPHRPRSHPNVRLCSQTGDLLSQRDAGATARNRRNPHGPPNAAACCGKPSTSSSGGGQSGRRRAFVVLQLLHLQKKRAPRASGGEAGGHLKPKPHTM